MQILIQEVWMRPESLHFQPAPRWGQCHWSMAKSASREEHKIYSLKQRFFCCGLVTPKYSHVRARDPKIIWSEPLLMGGTVAQYGDGPSPGPGSSARAWLGAPGFYSTKSVLAVGPAKALKLALCKEQGHQADPMPSTIWCFTCIQSQKILTMAPQQYIINSILPWETEVQRAKSPAWSHSKWVWS